MNNTAKNLLRGVLLVAALLPFTTGLVNAQSNTNVALETVPN